MKEKRECPVCRKKKFLQEDYYRDRSRPNGRTRLCKQCTKTKVKHWAKKNRSRYHAKHLERLYGLKQEKYFLLLQQQGGVCAICRQLPKRRLLSVDHIHGSRKIRGLLCDRCNFAIGLLQDSPLLCAAASAYLKKKVREI